MPYCVLSTLKDVDLQECLMCKGDSTMVKKCGFAMNTSQQYCKVGGGGCIQPASQSLEQPFVLFTYYV